MRLDIGLSAGRRSAAAFPPRPGSRGERRKMRQRLNTLRVMAGKHSDPQWLLHLAAAFDGVQGSSGLLSIAEGWDQILESSANLQAAANERLSSGGRPQPAIADNGVAVLPVYGLLERGYSLLGLLLGATSTTDLVFWLKTALSNDGVRAIALEFDSIGGDVRGIPEAAAQIASLRARKPMAAAVNGDAIGTAYWLAAAAGEIAASPSSSIGGVGVARIHREQSRRDDRAGITNTVIRAGDNKARTTAVEPLSPLGRELLQEGVDEVYSAFVQSLAQNRPNSKAALSDYAGAKTLIAPAAYEAGLIDSIATLEQVVDELGRVQ